MRIKSYALIIHVLHFSFLGFDHCLLTEVSGQNFVDEDHGGKLSNASKPKRLKRIAADASSNDQVMSTINTKRGKKKQYLG